MKVEPHLLPRAANHAPLTPAALLVRAAQSFPERLAVIWGERRWTYGAFTALGARLAAWLRAQGVRPGDVVSVMAPNRPEMLAAHFAVPAIGAVLNTVNTRLDADTVGYILGHCGSRLILADRSCLDTVREAARRAGARLVVLDPASPGADACGQDAAGLDRLDLLDEQAPEPAEAFGVADVTDEWQPMCVNYTSGTTGRPKGVVYHHRGGYLNALGNVLALGFGRDTVYLWTLPMFHCNGWCHTWAVTAAGGVHVCLDRPDPEAILDALEKHAVTHFACAPVVLHMLLNQPRPFRPPARRILVATGGAAPSATLIEALGERGIDVLHLYGLTESYGPATLMTLPETMAGAPAAAKAAFLARQGVSHAVAAGARVVDRDGRDVPADGRTQGEIVLAGNTVMAGYHADPAATEAAFAGGALHTGDLAVRHADGAIEIRDRAKDIIISGGENVSSIEVESVLQQHPAVLLAAVVAAPDETWGEVPCAFVEVKPGARVDGPELSAFCRARLAGFKVPRRFRFGELPKTATGKIQKFALRQRLAADAGDAEGRAVG